MLTSSLITPLYLKLCNPYLILRQWVSVSLVTDVVDFPSPTVEQQKLEKKDESQKSPCKNSTLSSVPMKPIVSSVDRGSPLKFASKTTKPAVNKTFSPISHHRLSATKRKMIRRILKNPNSARINSVFSRGIVDGMTEEDYKSCYFLDELPRYIAPLRLNLPRSRRSSRSEPGSPLRAVKSPPKISKSQPCTPSHYVAVTETDKSNAGLLKNEPADESTLTIVKHDSGECTYVTSAPEISHHAHDKRLLQNPTVIDKSTSGTVVNRSQYSKSNLAENIDGNLKICSNSAKCDSKPTSTNENLSNNSIRVPHKSSPGVVESTLTNSNDIPSQNFSHIFTSTASEGKIKVIGSDNLPSQEKFGRLHSDWLVKKKKKLVKMHSFDHFDGSLESISSIESYPSPIVSRTSNNDLFKSRDAPYMVPNVPVCHRETLRINNDKNISIISTADNTGCDLPTNDNVTNDNYLGARIAQCTSSFPLAQTTPVLTSSIADKRAAETSSGNALYTTETPSTYYKSSQRVPIPQPSPLFRGSRSCLDLYNSSYDSYASASDVLLKPSVFHTKEGIDTVKKSPECGEAFNLPVTSCDSGINSAAECLTGTRIRSSVSSNVPEVLCSDLCPSLTPSSVPNSPSDVPIASALPSDLPASHGLAGGPEESSGEAEELSPIYEETNNLESSIAKLR